MTQPVPATLNPTNTRRATKRLHSTNNMTSPIDYELANAA